jgi:hypothetical protein
MSNKGAVEGGPEGTKPGVHGPRTTIRRASLAFGILSFIAGLVLFVVLYGMLDIFVADLFGPVGLEAEGSELSETQEYIAQTWNLLPFVAVVVLATRFIARAAFESRGGI